MTAPHTPHSPNFAPRPLSPGEVLLRQPLAVPEMGQPTTPEQQQAELNTAAGHLNIILQAQAHDGRTTNNINKSRNQLASIYGGDLLDGIDAYLDDQRTINSADITQEHGVPQAEAALRALLVQGNTGAIVALMKRLGQQVDDMHEKNIHGYTKHEDAFHTGRRPKGKYTSGYTDFIHRHQAAEQTVTDAARSTLDARRARKPHGVSEPGKPPHYYDDKEKQKAYRKLERDHFLAETDAKEYDAKRSLPHAKALRDALKLESNIATAADQVVISTRMKERIDGLYSAERQAYTEKLERLTELQNEVTQELSTWGYGNMPADDDQRGRLAVLFDRWSQELEGMSRQDVNRHASLGTWVKERTRFEQRRAMLLPPDSMEVPEFSVNRGVCVNTTSGEHALFDDGSMMEGSDARRWPNGAEWQKPEAVAPFLDAEELAREPVEEQRVIRSQAIAAWEPRRTPETEADAAVASRALTERYNALLDVAQSNLGVANNIFTERREAHQQAVDNRADLVQAHIDELRAQRPDDDLNDIRNEAVVVIDGRIASLERARIDAENELNQARDDLRTAREDLNESEFARNYFGINRPDLAGIKKGTDVTTNRRGLVLIHNGTLNNTRGNWQLFPSGRARRFLTRNTYVEYAPDGETDRMIRTL